MNKISFSELSTFTKCPYKHYLLYTKNLRQEKVDSEYTSYGESIHAAAEDLFKNKDINTAQQIFKEKMDFFWNKNPQFNINKETLLNTGLIILTKLNRSPLLAEEFMYSEFKIEYNITEDIMFKGFVDLITYSKKDKCFYISDFKTTKKGWSLNDKADIMKKAQLYLYQINLSTMLNIPIENFKCRFIFFKSNDLEVESYILNYDEGDINKTKELFNSVVESLYRQKSGMFKFKNQYSCLFCEFAKNKEHCNDEDQDGYKIITQKEKSVLKEYEYDSSKDKNLYLPWRDISFVENIKMTSIYDELNNYIKT